MSRTAPTRAALAALLIALALPHPALAQGRTETLAITNARIHTMAGAPIEQGTVVVQDGRVLAVGANVPVPTHARVVDGAGKIVTPGFFVTGTDLAIKEVGASVPGANDSSAFNPEVTVAFDPSYAVNPDSIALALARADGVTRALLMPDLGRDHRDDGDGERLPPVIQGQSSIIHLGPGPDLVALPRVGVVIGVGEDAADRSGGSRGVTFVSLRALLEDARAFAASEKLFETGHTRPYRLSLEDLRVLAKVAKGELPLFLIAHRAADIRQALKLAADEKLKIVLMGAEEGWRVASEIAAAGVPVTVNPEHNLPDRFESLGSRLDNAARLEAAGVTVIIHGPGNGHYANRVRILAGTAVAHGLPYESALAAITSRPARVFAGSQTDGPGVIAPGREADLVLWDGDPLEIASSPQLVLVKGVPMATRTRQDLLAERYRR